MKCELYHGEMKRSYSKLMITIEFIIETISGSHINTIVDFDLLLARWKSNKSKHNFHDTIEITSGFENFRFQNLNVGFFMNCMSTV